MLILPPTVRADLESWIGAGYPEETCGLLVGRTLGARTEAARATRAANLERARDRFELDPAAWVAAERRARADGLEVVGVWHSHPDHPAEPSEEDRAGALAGWSYLIAAVTPRGVGALRAWRLEGARFVEEPLVRS